MHPHLPLSLKLKVYWPTQPQWGGGRDIGWARLLVPDFGPGGGLALMVFSDVMVFVLGGGTADFIRHIPRRVCLGCLPLHASLCVVADGGRMKGVCTLCRRVRRCTPLLLGWGVGVCWCRQCLVGWRGQVW